MQHLGESGLAYGICVGPSGQADRLALPAIRTLDPSAPVMRREQQTSIHLAYNSMIDEARSIGATGLILVHDDAAIRSPGALSQLTSLLADPTVGVVGAIGARNVHSIEWWWYDCHGFVEETEVTVDFGRSTADVDVVDGIVLGLSRSALQRPLRFDPDAYPPFHGYDFHICSEARDRGLRVVTTDLDVYHDSYPHGKITDPAAHAAADRAWRHRWRPGARNSLAYRSAVLRSHWKSPRHRLLRVLRK